MTSQQTYNFWEFMLGDGRGYLIPLDSARIAQNGLKIYHPQSTKARLFKHCLSLGFGSGILSRLLRKTKIDNTNYSNGLDNELFDFLKEALTDTELTFAVSLGTPAAHRKPVIQIMKDAEILGYAKIGWNRATLPLIRNEADTLVRLSESSLKSIAVPKLYYQGEWKGKYICIQSAPNGDTRSAPAILNATYSRVLENLSLIAPQELVLKKSSFWRDVLTNIAKVDHPYYRQVLEQSSDYVKSKVSGSNLKFHFRHGDFAPWNVKQTEGQYFVYDWEYARLESSAAWDLFHFFLQTHWLLKGLSAGQSFRHLISNEQLEKIFQDLYPEEIKYYREYLLIYLIDRLSFYAAEDPGNLASQNYLATLINLILYRNSNGKSVDEAHSGNEK